MCNLSKQLPNYSFSNGVITCYIDSIFEYITCQHILPQVINTIYQWKGAKVFLYGNEYSGSAHYWGFIDTVRRNAGKYESLVHNIDPNAVSLGSITYEQLPLPIVYYPESYGAFFAFSKDIGDKLYFCECQRNAIENYINLRKQNPIKNYTGAKTNPLGTDFFPKIISELSRQHADNPLETIEFKENLCFRCNKKIPLMKYCHPMYGGVFIQRFGWYIQEEKFRVGIDPYKLLEVNVSSNQYTPELYDYLLRIKQIDKCDLISQEDIVKTFNRAIENKVRDEFGYPKIGESWISETLLYYIIKKFFSENRIERHYRPKWLEGLELDIFIPEKMLAFEYQGIQHFRAVEHWGGEKQLKKQQEHDKRKATICGKKGIKLIYISYDEELSEEAVFTKIQNELNKK